MKLTLTLLLILSLSSFAQTELSEIIKKEDKNSSVNQKRRRKKVEMCQECGRPEPECECEGEGHGVKDNE